MKKLRYLAAAFSLTMTVGTVLAQGTPAHLATVLNQMNAASEKFQSTEADFQWDYFERVTRSTTTQGGTIFFQKQKDGTTEMGAKIVTPDLKLLGYKDGQLQVFDPKPNTLLRIDAKKNGSQVESFLTLGFGGSGRDLDKSWTITDQGMETIDGVSTAKLDLVSKDQNVRNMFTHVTIWVDLNRDLLLRQEFFTPSDDKRTATYKNLRYNAKIDRKSYEIKPNSKTSVSNR
jgi:outer membrane lipoprotein-sorting protein